MHSPDAPPTSWPSDIPLLPFDDANAQLMRTVAPKGWIAPVPKDRYHLVVIGAGTARSAADVMACSMAGARFIVSPGYTHSLGQACRDTDLPLLPGVATGSEIMAAQEDGFTELKFFPAMQAGGPAMLKAWGGPFGDVKFCPTGGVSLANAAEFLALSNVVCVGCSWLTPADAVAQGDWARITALALEASQLKRRS